jgi:hypothetical protein
MTINLITQKTKVLDRQTIFSYIALGLVVLAFLVYLCFEIDFFFKEMDQLDESHYITQIENQT